MITRGDKMAICEVYKYLRKVRPAYEQASQTQNGQLLGEME